MHMTDTLMTREFATICQFVIDRKILMALLEETVYTEGIKYYIYII